jgi:hypothetical protein
MGQQPLWLSYTLSYNVGGTRAYASFCKYLQSARIDDRAIAAKPDRPRPTRGAKLKNGQKMRI